MEGFAFCMISRSGFLNIINKRKITIFLYTLSKAIWIAFTRMEVVLSYSKILDLPESFSIYLDICPEINIFKWRACFQQKSVYSHFPWVYPQTFLVADLVVKYQGMSFNRNCLIWKKNKHTQPAMPKSWFCIYI